MYRLSQWVCVLLVVCLMVSFMLTGCSPTDEAANQTTTTGTTEEVQQKLVWEEKPDTGLFHTPQEIAVWKTRMETGPYKETGDVSLNSPGDWDRIVKNAEVFLARPASGRMTGKADQKDNFIVDAAFVYLLTGNKDMFEAVKGELLAQVAEPTAKISDWGLEGEDGFNIVNWVLRMLMAYDYIKDGLVTSERELLDAWFYDAASVFAYNINTSLQTVFPNRLKENYSVLGGVALSGNMRDKYTHVNADGSLGNQLSFLSSWYNNRRAWLVEACALIGIFLNDRDLIGQGKLFVKEMLMFGTFPDGTMGEYERNGNYGVPQQGMIYSTINIQACLLIADALARKGDFELYEYTTSEGLHGTEGGNKSIKLLVENYNNQTANTVERYYQTVAEENRIDTEDLVAGQYGVQKFVHHIWFAVGNRYWKDDFFKSVYKREVGPEYPNNPAGVAGSNSAWKGDAGQFPGILFMYGQMEDETSPYPEPIDYIKAPYNEVSYPDGMWYSSQRFSVGTYKLKTEYTASKQTIEFDVITSNDAYDGVTLWDGIVGFTGSSIEVNNYTDLPIIVQFSGGGSINVLDGNIYKNIIQIGYTKNKKYHFKIKLDLAAKKYDVWVTPDGNPEEKIAEGYAFRTDAPEIQDIGQISLHDFFDKGFKVRNLTIY